MPYVIRMCGIAYLPPGVSEPVPERYYLQSSDPDGRDGRGEEVWCDDVDRAKKFPTFEEAFECWRAQSTVVPLRPDGKPNRPMTAFTVAIERINDE